MRAALLERCLRLSAPTKGLERATSHVMMCLGGHAMRTWMRERSSWNSAITSFSRLVRPEVMLVRMRSEADPGPWGKASSEGDVRREPCPLVGS